MYEDNDRYQFQPWYIKLWRRRYYLYIPIDTFKSWIRSDETLKNCYSIAIGWAQCQMNWVYDWKELKKDKKYESK